MNLATECKVPDSISIRRLIIHDRFRLNVPYPDGADPNGSRMAPSCVFIKNLRPRGPVNLHDPDMSV
jgi:hypothetical protein